MLTLPHRYNSRLEFIKSTESQIPNWFEIETETLSSCLRRQAQLKPQAILLQNLEQAWTFEDVEHEANRIAQAILISLPSNKPCAIGILAEEMSEQVNAALGILKAGHYFVALNPENPYSYLQSICEDCEAMLIISDSEHSSLAEKLCRTQKILCLVTTSIAEQGNNPIININFSPDRYACILYTSGSTGISKGVIYTHRTLIFTAIEEMENFPRTENDRILEIMDMLFFPGPVRLTGQIIQGISFTFIHPRDVSIGLIRDVLYRKKITHFNTYPSMFRTVFNEFEVDDIFENLRVIRAGGEPVYRADVALFQSHVPEGWLFIHSMGISEIGYVGYSFIRSLKEITTSQLTLNTASHNKQIQILDETGKHVGTDIEGALYIQVSKAYQGYWNRESLNALSFIPDPTDDSLLLYHTHDRVKYISDGSMLHLGRSDQAVKVRGYRVDTTSVEAQLLLHPQIKQVIVLISEGETLNPQLIAYIVPQVIDTPPSRLSLRKYLAELMPSYMIPSQFKMIEQIPLKPHGKLDRSALATAKPI